MRITAVAQAQTPDNHPRSLHPIARLLIAALIVIQASLCWMAKDRSLRGDVDLRAFYTAGVMVRQGHAAHLYNTAFTAQTQQQMFGTGGRTLPFLYPAVAALPFVPLSFFPYRAVFIALFLVNLGLLYVSACLLSTIESKATFSVGIMFAFFLCFLPTSIVLMQGQISCVLLAIFALSCFLAERRRMLVAGLCLSLALVKFQFVLPVVVLLVLWRQWRIVSGFLLGTMGMVSLSVFLTGAQGAEDYLACLHGLGTSMLRDPASAQIHYGMQTSAEPNLHGLFAAMAGSGPISTLLLLFSSVLVLACAARSCRTIEAAMPAAMLVSYHMQPYDLLLLLLPIVASLQGVSTKQLRAQGIKASILMASVLLLTVPIAPYLILRGETVWFVLAVCGIFALGSRVLKWSHADIGDCEDEAELGEAFKLRALVS